MKITERKTIEIILVVMVLFIVAILIPMTLSLLVEAELPDGYEYHVKDNNGVIIYTALEESDNRTISVPFDEIEISYFIKSESNISVLIRDESRNGEWKISFYPDDGNSEPDIVWTSKEIDIGEMIFLPSGEKVTLLNFGEKGNPQFSVVVKSVVVK